MTLVDVEAELERIESERRRRKASDRTGLIGTLSILAVGIAATAAECLVAWLLWTEYRPLWAAPALHVCVCAFAGLAAWRVRPNGVRSRFLVLLALSLFFLGPFGPLGTMFAMLLHAWFRRSATPFDEWYESLFPEQIDAPSQRLYEMLMRGLADAASQDDVTSFTDVLQYGSVEQKRAVIALLSRDFRPEFAPALKNALADANPAVRVQAATAAANIESDFLERAIELETRARKLTGDAAAQLEAATHFDDYAFSGILDGDRMAENRRKAEDYYRRALSIDPDIEAAVTGMGRLLVRQERLGEATDWLEEGFARGMVSLAAVSWYMEAAYRLGDLDKVRYAVAGFGDDILNDPKASERLRDVIRLWAGRDIPSTAPSPELRLA